MADLKKQNVVNTRIKLRYDSYENWSKSTVELLPGEVALCYVPANTYENDKLINTAPTVLFKVGDGAHTFSGLKWASARAADVYDWAKAATNPSYTKEEADGKFSVVGHDHDTLYYRNSEIDTKVEELNKAIGDVRSALEKDTNTTYRFDLSEGNKLSIYSKELGGSESLVGTFAVDFSAINAEIEKKLNTETFNTFKSGYDKTIAGINESLAKKLEASHIEGKADTSYVNTELAKKADASSVYTKAEADGKFLTEHQSLDNYYNKAAVDGLVSPKADKSYVNEELAKKANASALDSYYTKTEIDGQVDGLESLIGGLDTKLEGALDDIEEIYGENGKIATITGRLDTAEGNITNLTNNKADKTELASYETVANADLVRGRVSILEGEFNNENGRVKVAEGKISTLEGAVSTIMNGTNPEKIDSLNDLIEWADEHAPEVASIKKGIEANAKAIEGLTSSKADKTDLNGYYTKGEVDEIKSGLESSINGVDSKFAGYYTQTEIDTKVSTLEGSISTVDGKLVNYETIAEADKVRGRVGTLEGQVANLHNYDDADVRSLISGNAAEIKTLKETTVPGLEDRIEVLEGKPFGSYATKSEVATVDGKVDGIIADYLKGADKTELSNAIASAVKTEKERAEAAEKGLGDRLTAVENEFTTVTVDGTETKGRVVELEEKVATLATKTEVKKVADAVKVINETIPTLATKSEVAETYETKVNVTAVSDRVKAIEDDATILRSTDYIVFDCGGAN